MQESETSTGTGIAEVREFSSRVGNLASIRAFVRQTRERAPWGPVDIDTMEQVELAVNEAVSNIIEHALRGDPGHSIRVEVTLRPGTIQVDLYHDGESFDPSGAPPPAFDGTRDGGFGLYMISECMDEVHYIHKEDGVNCIRLVKREGGI